MKEEDVVMSLHFDGELLEFYNDFKKYGDLIDNESYIDLRTMSLFNKKVSCDDVLICSANKSNLYIGNLL